MADVKEHMIFSGNVLGGVFINSGYMGTNHLTKMWRGDKDVSIPQPLFLPIRAQINGIQMPYYISWVLREESVLCVFY